MSEVRRYKVHVDYHKPEETSYSVYASDPLQAIEIVKILFDEKIAKGHIAKGHIATNFECTAELSK